MDIPGVLMLLKLWTGGRKVAEGALQKAEGLKGFRLCVLTMAKRDTPKVT